MVAVVAMLLIAPGAVVAQGVPTPPKEVIGTVTDQNGNAVSDETVTVSDEDGNSYTSTTDANGDYLIQFPAEDGEAGEILTVEVGDSTSQTTFQAGETERIDLEVTVNTGGGDDGGDDDGGYGGGGGGGGGAGTGGDGGGVDVPDISDDLGDDAEVSDESEGVITSDPTTVGGSTVEFSPTSNVESIDFSGEVEGTTNVRNIAGIPEATGSPPGTVVLISDITVPKDARDSPATVRMRVSSEQLDEVGVEADGLAIYRYSDGEWSQLDTEVASETDSGVILEAETPGFSIFAVATVEDQPADGGTDGDTADDADDTADDTTNDGIPGFGFVVALVALVGAALLATRQR